MNVKYTLPAMPALDPAAVAAHDAAQAALAEAVGEAPPRLAAVFRRIQLRILQEAAASIEAPYPEVDPPLVPPRRRFLSPAQVLRLEGCSRALRYVDSRVAMRRMGALARVVDRESPMVLHAFADGGEPHERDSNPGSIRVTPNRFAPGDIEYLPPPADQCRQLLTGAVEFANAADAPAVTRAGWLMQVVFAIHPFVDGNGRTGRLLFHAVLSEELPLGIDWGTIPELAARRGDYLEATRRPLRPSLPDYDGRLLEPIHLMTHLVEAATIGARRTLARLRKLGELHERLLAAGLDAEAALVVLVVAADRNVRLSEIDGLSPEAGRVAELAQDLVDLGWLRWDRAGHLQVAGPNPFAGR